MRPVLIIGVAALLSACTGSANWSSEALAGYGFKDVRLGGWAMFGCDEKDTFHRVFTATSATGRRVKGVVCGGIFKGATVRITGAA